MFKRGIEYTRVEPVIKTESKDTQPQKEKNSSFGGKVCPKFRIPHRYCDWAHNNCHVQHKLPEFFTFCPTLIPHCSPVIWIGRPIANQTEELLQLLFVSHFTRIQVGVHYVPLELVSVDGLYKSQHTLRPMVILLFFKYYIKLTPTHLISHEIVS